MTGLWSSTARPMLRVVCWTKVHAQLAAALVVLLFCATLGSLLSDGGDAREVATCERVSLFLIDGGELVCHAAPAGGETGFSTDSFSLAPTDHDEVGDDSLVSFIGRAAKRGYLATAL
eukprot:4822887-Amphidinium_carterae.1